MEALAIDERPVARAPVVDDGPDVADALDRPRARGTPGRPTAGRDRWTAAARRLSSSRSVGRSAGVPRRHAARGTAYRGARPPAARRARQGRTRETPHGQVRDSRQRVPGHPGHPDAAGARGHGVRVERHAQLGQRPPPQPGRGSSTATRCRVLLVTKRRSACDRRGRPDRAAPRWSPDSRGPRIDASDRVAVTHARPEAARAEGQRRSRRRAARRRAGPLPSGSSCSTRSSAERARSRPRRRRSRARGRPPRTERSSQQRDACAVVVTDHGRPPSSSSRITIHSPAAPAATRTGGSGVEKRCTT